MLCIARLMDGDISPADAKGRLLAASMYCASMPGLDSRNSLVGIARTQPHTSTR
jgi:hypothetical protein